jgi:hypothetical protein
MNGEHPAIDWVTTDHDEYRMRTPVAGLTRGLDDLHPVDAARVWRCTWMEMPLPDVVASLEPGESEPAREAVNWAR